MSEHVCKRLEAYLDGQLSGQHCRTVEAHLSSCESCREELEELRSLSALLSDTKPEAENVSADRFTAQVMLQLPRREPASPQGTSSNGMIWWLVPVVLLFIWLFTQTVMLITGLVSSADQFGLLGELSGHLVSGLPRGSWIIFIFGVVNQNFGTSSIAVLDIYSDADRIARTLGFQVLWQSIILLLFWSWMVIWYVHRQRKSLES